jgi:FkbM family methyltransferase
MNPPRLQFAPLAFTKLPPALRFPPEAADDARLIAAGEYDLPLKESPATILDAGAHVGLFTWWASHRWPEAQISAYEPDSSNYIQLNANLDALDLSSSVQTHFAALSCRGGQSYLVPGRNSLCGHISDEGQAVPARQVDLVDASGIGSPEFVKVDTEGHELTILTTLDLSQTKAVVMEAHSEFLRRACATLLLSTGFECVEDRPTLNGCHLLKFVRPGALHESALRPPPSVLRHPSSGLRPPSSTPKLMVAIPVYGQVPVGFMESLINLHAAPPCDMVVRMVAGDSLVSRARNTLTHEFLLSDCTHLLFIDSDLVFSPQHVGRLMEHPEQIVAGLYPKKQSGTVQWVINALTPDDPPVPRTAAGLQAVRYAGTGFLRIAREVFEVIAARDPSHYFTCDHDASRTEYDFWRVGVHPTWAANPDPKAHRRHLSEDWYFCQLAREAGYTVWADGGVILKHLGTTVWPDAEQTKAIFGQPPEQTRPLPDAGTSSPLAPAVTSPSPSSALRSLTADLGPAPSVLRPPSSVL